MNPSQWLSNPLSYRLGLTLLHFLWQGMLIAAMAVAIVHLFGVNRGRARYAIYLAALGLFILAPLITFAVIRTPPQFEISNLRALTIQRFDIVPLSLEPIPWWVRAKSRLAHALPWITAFWLIGIAVLSVRLAGSFVYTIWCRGGAAPLPPHLMERVRLVAERVGLPRFRRVLSSPRARLPIAVGLLRPMVLLPAALVTQMPVDMLEAIIAHELAHIRRLDLWVNLLQRLVETFLFYHPAVWWISARIREEREICCDEIAAGATRGAVEYASMLERVARIISGGRSALVAGLGNRQSLLARVRHILRIPVERRLNGWPVAAVATVALAMIIVGACTARRAGAQARPASSATQPATAPAQSTVSSVDAARDAIRERLREREELLSDLKHRYQQRNLDLVRDLRDKGIKLSVEGMGTPGRLSTREMELTNLIQRQMDVDRSINENKTALAQAEAHLESLDDSFAEKIEQDPRLNGYVQQVDEIDLKLADGSVAGPEVTRMEKRKAVLKEKIGERRNEMTANLRGARLRSLKDKIEADTQARDLLNKEIGMAKQDLGDLNYQLGQYQNAKEEEARTREIIHKLSEQIDRLSMLENQKDANDPDWSEIERSIFGTQPAK